MTNISWFIAGVMLGIAVAGVIFGFILVNTTWKQ